MEKFELSLAEIAAQHTLHLTTLLNRTEEDLAEVKKLASIVAHELRNYCAYNTAGTLDRLIKASAELEKVLSP